MRRIKDATDRGLITSESRGVCARVRLVYNPPVLVCQDEERAIEPTVAAYTQGDPFQQEKRAVFGTAWLPLCHVAQLPANGDFCAQTVGGWPLFALRGADGGVRAFRNVCRHQGMQVVDKPNGNCTELRCRFHGWTYDLEGRFASAPAPVAPADTSAGTNDLTELPSATHRGLVFCTLDDAARGDGELTAALHAAIGSADARHAASVTVDIGCNWKTYVEHRLGSEGGAGFVWPLLVIDRAPQGVVVEQIIRTFLRTRVMLHGMGAVDMPALQQLADAAKAASEALQAQRAAGTMPVESGATGALWARLAAATRG